MCVSGWVVRLINGKKKGNGGPRNLQPTKKFSFFVVVVVVVVVLLLIPPINDERDGDSVCVRERERERESRFSRLEPPANQIVGRKQNPVKLGNTFFFFLGFFFFFFDIFFISRT